jgi:hypothetical protein
MMQSSSEWLALQSISFSAPFAAMCPKRALNSFSPKSASNLEIGDVAHDLWIGISLAGEKAAAIAGVQRSVLYV